MDKNLIKEIKRFLEKNYIKIIITGAVIAVVYTSISFLGAYLNQREELSTSPESEQEMAESGEFRFYIENTDGEVYSNITIFEEYFLLPEILNEAEKTLKVEISDLLEQQELSEFEKTIEDRGVIGVGRNQSSGIYTFRVNIGSSEDNLEVTEFYYDYLLSEEIPVLENKNLFIIEEPHLDELNGEEVGNFASTERMDTPVKVLKALVFDFILGLILGMVVSTFGYIFFAIVNKKILYSFTYNWEMSDHHLIVNKSNEEMKDAVSLLLHPTDKQKILLSDNSSLREMITSELEKYDFVNIVRLGQKAVDDKLNILLVENFSDIDPLYQFEEIVYAIQVSSTTKRWYYKQRNLTEHYPLDTKVIQFND